MHRKFFNLILVLVLLGGCSHSPKIDSIKPEPETAAVVDRKMIIGSWYSELPTKDDQIRKSLVRRRADGTFTAHFQLFRDKRKVLDVVESGYWGIAGNIYFTVTREFLKDNKFVPFDTTDASYYDAYKVIDLKSDFFRCKSIDSDNEFESKKVADSFRLDK